MKRFICEISDFLDMKMKKKTKEEDDKKKAEGFPPQIPTPDYNIKKIAGKRQSKHCQQMTRKKKS